LRPSLLSLRLNRMGLTGGGVPLFNIVPLGFGASMALIDAFMLSFLKYMSIDASYVKWIFVPMIVYAAQPVLFYFSLKYESLTVMNLLWDVISDVLVTFIGVMIFKETIGPYKKAGVFLSFLSIILMSINDGE
jgi:drug/metabolite transporter (DMT)-like permease